MTLLLARTTDLPLRGLVVRVDTRTTTALWQDAPSSRMGLSGTPFCGDVPRNPGSLGKRV